MSNPNAEQRPILDLTAHTWRFPPVRRNGCHSLHQMRHSRPSDRISQHLLITLRRTRLHVVIYDLGKDRSHDHEHTYCNDGADDEDVSSHTVVGVNSLRQRPFQKHLLLSYGPVHSNHSTGTV